MIPILQVDSCSRIFQKGHNQVEALKNVTFSMNTGETVSLIGRSGSGKSTLLNLIGGLDKADSGHIWIQGEDLTSMDRTELARHRRYTVGMIFQSFNLIPSRTALENVMLALAFGGKNRNDRKKIGKRLLGSVGLAERLNHRPGELSGGECQRVAIARALANHPLLLLADEPTGNLDSKTSLEIYQLLSSLSRKGLSVLMVTHDESGAEKISHRILEILDGQIICERKLKDQNEAG
jgi:putative ABC transport system ATP-binding protein